MHIIVQNNLAKRLRVYREQDGAKNGALRNTAAQLSRQWSSYEEQQKKFCFVEKWALDVHPSFQAM